MENAMERATMSFEDKRRALLLAASEGSQEKGVIKEVPFTNEDVPDFLEQLRRFQRESRKAHIVAK